MTSGQESSAREPAVASLTSVESLGGFFHPHAIEVQDFSCYALVIDVRPLPAFDDDHIPGAMHVPPDGVSTEPQIARTGREEVGSALVANDVAAPAGVPPCVLQRLAGVGFDRAILVYCGRGGADSLPLAKTLRWLGWTVDVLPGGWINYRRWVQAGLETLPRLVSFRVLSVTLDCEARRVLQALSAAGQQVLDIETMANAPVGAMGALGDSAVLRPPQAWFESQLLQALRDLDPRYPVWVRDIDRRLGDVVLPGALVDAMDRAPVATVRAPRAARVDLWLESELRWRTAPLSVIDAIASRSPPPDPKALSRWRAQAVENGRDMVTSVLRDHLDAAWQARVGARLARANTLPALNVGTLAQEGLAAAVRAWLPATGEPPIS